MNGDGFCAYSKAQDIEQNAIIATKYLEATAKEERAAHTAVMLSARKRTVEAMWEDKEGGIVPKLKIFKAMFKSHLSGMVSSPKRPSAKLKTWLACSHGTRAIMLFTEPNSNYCALNTHHYNYSWPISLILSYNINQNING